jgi:hypothetical protein
MEGLSKNPPLDRRRTGGRRELAAVVLGFGVLTIALTWPLAAQLGSVGRADNGDGRISIWNVAWVARALALDPSHVFDANIFYPHRGTLAYSELNLGAGILAVPVYWLTRNPYAAHNFVFILSFVLSATGAYYLVRHLTGDWRAAVIAATAFAFCPYVFAHTPHIQLLMTAGLPLSMLAFHRLDDEPTAGRGAALGAVMAAQALFCGYYAVFVMLMIGYAVLVIAIVRRRWTDRAYWTAVAVAAGVSLALAVPLFVPYLQLQRDTGFGRSLADARPWSAQWLTYLASASPVHIRLLTRVGTSEVLFPGLVALICGVEGFVRGIGSPGRRRVLSILYGGLAALALWASFGPSAWLYRMLYEAVPVFSLLHAPSRFGLVVTFSLSVLAGVALAELFARRRRAAATAAAVFALTVFELHVPLTFPKAPPSETAYRVLASLPYGALLEMPVFSRRFAFARTEYMLSSTIHWMPIVDAYSDYIPQDFNDNADVLGGFPSRASFRLLARDHVRYVMFHLDLFDPNARAEVLARVEQFSHYLAARYADDRLRLYEIVGTPP